MPQVQFFDFANRPTYLFFRWVREGGGGQDPIALVSAAMNAAEHEDFFEIDGDVSSASHGALTKLLGTVLDGLCDAANCERHEDTGAPVDPDPEWMMGALLFDAIGHIILSDVAQAMLVEAGKWNPDRDIPEAE